MKRKPYKVKFKIQVLCCGIISYAEGHTTILATSEEDAEKKVRNDISLTYLGSVTISQIDL